MTSLWNKIFGPNGIIARALMRLQQALARMFFSRRAQALRASDRCKTLRRKEDEAERIDRLRNPSHYQGR
jgi:hypothetical protein